MQVRVAVVGAGSVGMNHLRVLKDFEAERVQLVGVAVVVPTHLHSEVTSYVLDRGINVLIGKPITKTIDEALALLQLAKVRGVKIAVGHVERFNPPLPN